MALVIRAGRSGSWNRARSFRHEKAWNDHALLYRSGSGGSGGLRLEQAGQACSATSAELEVLLDRRAMKTLGWDYSCHNGGCVARDHRLRRRVGADRAVRRRVELSLRLGLRSRSDLRGRILRRPRRGIWLERSGVEVNDLPVARVVDGPGRGGAHRSARHPDSQPSGQSPALTRFPTWRTRSATDAVPEIWVIDDSSPDLEWANAEVVALRRARTAITIRHVRAEERGAFATRLSRSVGARCAGILRSESTTISTGPPATSRYCSLLGADFCSAMTTSSARRGDTPMASPSGATARTPPRSLFTK